MSKENVHRLTQLLNQWMVGKNLNGVGVVFDEGPENEPNQDYDIELEVTFAPAALDKARLEISLSTDGFYVGMGAERTNRIASRLGIQKSSLDRYVAGFEPRLIDDDGITGICDILHSGKFRVKAYTLFNRLFASEMVDGDGWPISLLSTISTNLPVAKLLSKISIVTMTEMPYRAWDAIDK